MVSLEECDFVFRFRLDDSLFIATKAVKDLRFNVGFSSDSEECQMDVRLALRYDDNRNNRESTKYMVLAFLVALYDFILIVYTMLQFESYEFLCKSQSVIFWTGVGMYNCLLCFVNIYFSTENMDKVSLYFILAIFNFANFSFVILRILHKIGRVHIGALISGDVS